ncbi:alpha-L-fucosidase [Salinibacterium sp. NK8237]|uniref:alpha-L-fucosidase n=1 Tax=Salinibacterium sp. NK8237 TaxID=2792038 RepID=UPI0018CCCE5D|nr:alpha-L-fucosidase [Salinibacterium sp. NK8237]
MDKGVAITTAIAPTDWFADAGFGVFVHFGHASRRGWELSWQMTGGVEGQLPPMKPVACAEYFANASEFNPSEFDADVWAEAIANSGARYAVFTTKHHDGFAMFDTEYNDYSIVKTSPFGRDITAELVSALRARDIKIGLYFSLPDWHHPEYPRMTDETATKPFKIGGYVRTSPEQWARYRSFFIDQLTELLTKYGTIDVMWLDGIFDHTAEEWDFGQIREHIRTLQPNCLVNDRCVGFGDFATPEQQLPEVSPLVPWEVCMTMNESWGWVPDDTQWKTTPQLLTSLSRIIATGGNLLLNVGPQGDGTFPLEATERLEAIGEWIARNREAVHGITRPADNIRGTLPVGYKKVDGGERLYIYCIMRPWDTLSLAGVPVNRVDNVRVVGTDEPLPFMTAASLPEVHRGATDPLGEVQITLPADVGDSFMPVIAVDIRDA